ncbi:hypothetical protein ACSFA8_26605 [Variovorax sp. RT4R15]
MRRNNATSFTLAQLLIAHACAAQPLLGMLAEALPPMTDTERRFRIRGIELRLI